MANLVASSVAVAIRHSKLVGKFSGNGGLVASLVAECDGKNGGNRILVAKGVATLHGKHGTGNLANTFWRQQRCHGCIQYPVVMQCAIFFPPVISHLRVQF